MRMSCLAAMMTVGTMALASCGGDTAAPRAAFELDGSWVFLGPGDGPHTLKISDTSMVYTDLDGQWSSSWSIKQYDNALHHFQVTFGSGTGTYIPVGQNMTGTYVLNAPMLAVQLGNSPGSYPSMESPDSCTDAASTPIPDCRLYMKQ